MLDTACRPQPRIEYDLATYKKWFFALPLMKALLPPPYVEVAPVSSLYVSGEIQIRARLQHTESHAGEQWMWTREIDLMISTLLWDGRYNDDCFVLSCDKTQLIESAFFMYCSYQKAQNMFNAASKKGDVDMAKVHEAIEKRYLLPVHVLAERYEMLRNGLLSKIVNQNPGMLTRRVLVFPTNEKLNHWNATFVFNPSYIDYVADDDMPDDSALRPCFFRYCSIKTRWSTQRQNSSRNCLVLKPLLQCQQT